MYTLNQFAININWEVDKEDIGIFPWIHYLASLHPLTNEISIHSEVVLAKLLEVERQEFKRLTNPLEVLRILFHILIALATGKRERIKIIQVTL